MDINLEVVGGLKEHFDHEGSAPLILKERIKHGTSVKDLFLHLAKKYPGFREFVFLDGQSGHSVAVMVVLNGTLFITQKEFNHILEENDKIILLPLVMGG